MRKLLGIINSTLRKNKQRKQQESTIPTGLRISHTVIPVQFENAFPVWDKQLSAKTIIYID